ncbi:MAG: GlxA family transcriptional regulator [Rhodobiaceae bacterium]|nr:GlxA family transcriptional regulator [Rhodobiaceae bacterium]MCC0041861.1 GlxA family transcriptional regulator [Rhodobiaceae bacterium]
MQPPPGGRPMPEALQARAKGPGDVERELSVGFVLLNNFTLTPFATFVDALRLAGDEADLSRPIRCRWSIVSSARRPVKASCGIEIMPEEPLGDPSRFDYVVVVGGLLHKGAPADEQTLTFLREAARRNVSIVGLCTATLTLIRAGIMNGHRCCVSWFHYQDLMREFPEITAVADQVFVVDRRRITCAGGAGALDVAAWIIERQFGRAMAQKCLHILLVDQARPPNAAQPHPPGSEHVRDARVRRAILMMEQTMATPVSMRDLASRLNITPRHLERLFHAEVGISPQEYYRLHRLRFGRFLLVTTDRRISDIALECGFSDASHFTRAFREAFEQTPSQTRNDAERAATYDVDARLSQASQPGF